MGRYKGGRDEKAWVQLVCSCGCGTSFSRRRSIVKPGYNYATAAHASAHRSRLYMEEMCGDYLPMVGRYLKVCEREGLKSVSDIRTSLAPFFLFLNEKSITTIRKITPHDIDDYLDWAEEFEYKSASHNISALSSFFQWANTAGLHDGGSPITRFHREKRPVYLPRPYTHDQMAFIWSLLGDRGNARLRAVVAICEEAGLRLGEVCRLRRDDVDLESMTLFVGLPNKGNRERLAWFHEKAAHYIQEWLLERSPDADHDLLFHNKDGNPLLPQTLHKELCRTMCRMYAGQVRNLDGMDEWSTHRLRHTMASNLASAGATITTIMEAGGWTSLSSLSHYAKVEIAAARRDYDEAMRKVRTQERSPSVATVLTHSELRLALGL